MAEIHLGNIRGLGLQGQAGRTFYILLRGEVAVLESTFTAEGGEVSRREVNRLRAGAWCAPPRQRTTQRNATAAA